MSVMRARAFFIFVLSLCLSLTLKAQEVSLKARDFVQIELERPVEDAPNITSCYKVSKDGTLDMPYLDHKVRAVGLTVSELKEVLERSYQEAEIYDKPAFRIVVCDVTVSAPYVVAVGGEVRSPHEEIPLRDGMRLYQAIMAAGGPTEFADLRRVKLSRVKLIRGRKEISIDVRRIIADQSNNPLLMDGDTIHIPSAEWGVGEPLAVESKVETGEHALTGKPAGLAPSQNEPANTGNGESVKVAALTNEPAGDRKSELRQKYGPQPVSRLADAAASGNPKPAAKAASKAREKEKQAVTLSKEREDDDRIITVRMDGVTLYQALMLTGGIGPFDRVERIEVVRDGEETLYDLRRIEADGSNNPVLKTGDVVVVGRRE